MPQQRRPFILIVDDEPLARHGLKTLIGDAYPCDEATNGREAVAYIEKKDVDLVLLDITMPEMNGFQALQKIKEHDPTIEVIMVSADVSEETGLRARKLGAFSYITKPSLRVDPIQYLNAIERALEKRETTQEAADRQEISRGALDPIIGKSKTIQNLKELIPKYAELDLGVLIEGPTGVGKELVARAIHAMGPRASHPFVAVNCSAVPATLFAAEMFGSERGAFTGASERRKGKFELAHRGTLFLDEIGALPKEQQVMLLRAVEGKVIQRLGGEKEIPLDLRIIAATDTNLKQAMGQNQFDAPLYYRLNGLSIYIPPLRERPEDIETLLAFFVDQYNKKFRKQKRLSAQANARCCAYPWPGNVREMKALIERAIAIYPGEEILADHLPIQLSDHSLSSSQATPSPMVSPPDPSTHEGRLHLSLQADSFEALQYTFEQQLLSLALKASGGKLGDAARLLHMDPKTFRTKLRKHQLKENSV